MFDGNSQVLDHILVSKSWKGVQYDIVHTNSEFHDQDSDHDPQVVRLRIGWERLANGKVPASVRRERTGAGRRLTKVPADEPITTD